MIKYLEPYFSKIKSNPFYNFVRNNKSLSLIFLSMIITAIVTTASIISLLIHIVNYILLFAMRWKARRTSDGKTVSILMLIAIALTALSSDYGVHGVILFQIFNIIVLASMWWSSSIERSKI